VPLDVVPVTTRRDLRRFVDLPWRLFDRARNPQWVPPLRATVYDALDRARNPFYADADRELFLALRDGVPVGRIVAIENRAHNRFNGDRTGFWGFFECVDDQAVAEAIGLNRTDMRCLDVIQREGPVPAGRLADETGLTTGAITTVLDRLERAGFARRTRDPADRRRVLVELAPEARSGAGDYYGRALFG